MIIRFNDMIELKSKGRFEVVEYNLPRTPVETMLMEEKSLGLDMMYKRVCSCLKDEQIEIGGYQNFGFAKRLSFKEKTEIKLGKDSKHVSEDENVVVR
ncbi:hypothetical protein CK203_044467 [Vitis vinifera]|uniref:Uncharacterized protein n=1 Tax=Vitis vinifera TaxID=29760 RepID=A0A438HB49_VITVI|nr:hypothetical protein CK203_044467 [Vitis vinifera]